MLKVKDFVGGIYKRTKDGKEEWYLLEDTINKIVENGKGRKYYTKSKFRPLDADDVDDNTEIQEDTKGKDYILTNSVFGLNDVTRPMAEKWIKWANENMNKAVSIML